MEVQENDWNVDHDGQFNLNEKQSETHENVGQQV
jgi:hypothetical protein